MSLGGSGYPEAVSLSKILEGPHEGVPGVVVYLIDDDERELVFWVAFESPLLPNGGDRSHHALSPGGRFLLSLVHVRSHVCAPLDALSELLDKFVAVRQAKYVPSRPATYDLADDLGLAESGGHH